MTAHSHNHPPRTQEDDGIHGPRARFPERRQGPAPPQGHTEEQRRSRRPGPGDGARHPRWGPGRLRRSVRDGDAARHVPRQDGAGVGEDEVVKLAVVLGSEKTGLLDEDANMCDVMLGVPTDPRFGSLNLSGAVQVLAYDLRMALGGKDSYADDR
ncbi:hypothetical protein THAOC_00458 [Thalassiosira oceanica]|uniref:tRNA/rRNA methyltransferase SpoU type domain-containing protein n=1 Tax=Thalassiosira oceanica TaxID=159749 RepID=K0TG83_THAOC|nr:hypothetical protein THAOC_00458 [Thalassiosira oceanica]|eukprot:EJK77693.1 hypothetical protein THAOC_00458 [Thalassiosira oceanica]